MNKRFTLRIWTAFCLFLLVWVQNAHAQYPKWLTQYPVVTSASGGINSLTQKGNVIYMAGDFNSIGKKPVLNGVTFDKVGDTAPNVAFVAPNNPNGTSGGIGITNNAVTCAIPDDAGGFYIFGAFDHVGGVSRDLAARINADGTLNSWNPHAEQSDVFPGFGGLYVAVKAGNNVIAAGASFSSFPGQTYQSALLMLDGTTGAALPGWGNLQIPFLSQFAGQAEEMIVSNNKLYILGFNNNTAGSDIAVVDISDINNPFLVNSFKIDATDMYGSPLTINQNNMAIANNTIYLSAASMYGDPQNQTTSGQAFNSTLFAIDATTGNFIKAFTPPSDIAGAPTSLAVDGNTIYMAYLTGAAGATGTTGKLAAFNSTTGADISATLPTIITSSERESSTNLTVTADHKLYIYGGFTSVNGNDQSLALIDLTTNTLSDWKPKVGLPAIIAESNGKVFMGGSYVSYGLSYPRTGLAAFNASTGEILPWAPNDFKAKLINMALFKSISISNNTLYIGGNFTSSDNSETIENLAAYDITDPNNPVLKTDWTPNPDGVINALTIKGTTLFAGGDFTHITGQAKKRLAAFDISSNTGTLNAWNPGADGLVNTFTVLDNNLYAGGVFTNIGTTPRVYAAAFDFSASGNGGLTAWDPKIANNGSLGVLALAAQPADGTNHAARVFIGGFVYSIGANNTAVNTLAAVNTTDGTPDTWQFTGGFNGSIPLAVSVAKNELYIGGQNFFNSADISNNFAQLDATNYLYTDGQTSFGDNVNAILFSANQLFIGGTFGSRSGTAALGDPGLIGLAVLQTGDIVPMITFTDMTNIYGDAPLALAATSTVVTNPITYSISTGDNPDNVVSFADGKITILKPGVATITASQTGAADVKAKITISKAVLTVSPKDATSVVNQPFPDFPFTITGWKNGDDTKSGIYTGKPAFTSTGTPTSPAGAYDLTVSGAGTLTSDYYTFTPSTAKATLTINTTGSTAQTITFAALPAKTYGDADITLGATTSASVLSVTYKSSDDSIATVTGNKLHIAGAGTVTITASQAGDPTYAPATDVPQTFTIVKAALTIKADDKTINRGDQLPTFTATYTGLVNGDGATDLDTPPTFTTTATQASNPGSYPITAANAASDNYNITYVAGTLTIKGTQIITFAPVSTLTYGDAAFNPGATSDAGASFTPVYTTSNPSVIAISGGQAVIKGAGTATITATFAAANGFELTTATENITVQPKALTATADDKTKNFGDPLPAFTVTYNGFVNNDSYTTPGVFSTPPVANTTATATSPAGTYPITVNGGVSTNYTLSYFPGTLTVTPVARTITFNTLPNKTYGDADFNPGATSNTGEQATYSVADPTVATVTGNQIHITGAGSTTITATFPANSGYTGASTATQTLTVGKAALTITADNKSKSQGPPDILLTATYSGFVGTDNQLNLTARPTLTTTANVNSPTGTYPITISGASSPNYDITYVNGTLTIIFGVGQDQIVVHPMLSPNGDGKNDFMLIDGIQNYPDNHVVVVDRNGAKVYEAKGYDNSSIVFAGKNSSGNSLVAGTYYYEVNYTLKGNPQRKAGYIIIKY